MSNTISVSKIVNEISFRLNNTEYKRCQDKIKRMASLWVKSTNQISKSLDAGRKISNYRQKEIKDTSRAELKAYRQRQQILKADNIRYSDQIKASRQFQASLQKINSDFMKGTTNQKIRSAQIAQLTKQYKALNAQATQHNRITGIASKIGPGVRGAASTGVGLAATGAGVVGAAGYAMHQGYESVKGIGQGYEKLLIGLTNTFGADRAGAISNQIRAMSDEMGQPVLQLGEQLTNYVSIVKALGIETDKAIDMFKKQSNMTASYGMSQDQIAGFQYGLMQTMSSNTLEDFKQTMDWSAQIKSDFLAFLKQTKGISQKEFVGNLTNGKYNFKEFWMSFVEATAPKYAQMSSLYKSSSMANDTRADNSISLAIYRVFSSTGFKEALKYTTNLLNRWGFFLESNAKQIGEVFGNLYKITGELADGALKDLTVWLKSLTAEDIRSWFNDFKSGLQDLAFIIKTVATKLKAMFPDLVSSSPDAKGQYYVEREKHWLNSGYDGQEAGRLAEGEMRRKFNLGFEVLTFNENLVQRWNVNPQPIASNFAGTLNLTVDANVNRQGFNDLIDFKINDNNMSQINLIAQ